MMHRITFILLASWLLATGAAADENAPPSQDDAAARACAERTVAAVQKRYLTIRDLHARFEQTSRSVTLGSSLGGKTASRGVVTFAKPGKMRWEYTEPEASLMVTDGRTLTIYDPARQEAQRLTVGAGYLSGAAIQFLLGEGDILGAFEVTTLDCEADIVELELLPREPATYEKLQIRVDPATATVVGTSMFDLLGNETHVAFADIETNRAPGDETFVFDPPEGVRVMELEPLRPAGEGGP